MFSYPLRFTTRVVVFDESDIFEALKQLAVAAKTMDLGLEDSAVIPMKYSRAARIHITEQHSPNIFKQLQPLMFNLTCNFNDRAELNELLKDTPKFVRMKLDQYEFEAGLQGDVPSMKNSAPFGVWILTRIEAEPPSHILF